MINTILKYIKPGNRQSVMDWSRYTSTLDLRTNIFRTRFLAGPCTNSPIVNLITHILSDVNWTPILALKGDYTRYTKHIDPLTTIYRNTYDPAYTNRNLTNLFTNADLNVADYVLNVSHSKPMSTYPFDKPFKDWASLKPIHVLHHDGLELVTDLSKFNIQFKSSKPTRVLVTLDITLLFFKYLKYMELCVDSGDQPSILLFIQKYIVNDWFDDLRRIWLFNVLSALVFNDITKRDILSFKNDQTIAPNEALLSATSDVYRECIEVKQKNLTLDDFLSTEWLGSGISIYTWLKTMQSELNVPKLRQYNYLQFMMELPYVKFVIKINNIIGVGDSVKINRELIYLINRYNDQNIYMNITSPVLRDKLKQEVAELLTLVKQNKYL